MGKAARAIIIENDRILVMHRNKHGSQYFTLVGGRVNDDETIEQGLMREIKEETGLQVTQARFVFYEPHVEPYNEQYIFLCQIAPHGPVGLMPSSEEALMNQIAINVHTPVWADIKSFQNLPFRTPQLQAALIQAFKKGFPKEPVRL